MTARQYINKGLGTKAQVLEVLHGRGASDELGFAYHDCDMGTNEDGMYCEITEVEEAMLEIELTEDDIKEIEGGR